MATILVIDKNMDSCKLLKRVLEGNGHTVIADLNETAALEHLGNLEAHLVIIHLSRDLSEADKLGSQLKKKNPNLRILWITNFCKDLPPDAWDDYLIKPVDIDAVENKVKELLQKDSASGGHLEMEAEK